MSLRLVLITAFALAAGPHPIAGQSRTLVETQPKPATPQCFLSRDWGSWRPSADSRSIYLRVGVREVYRLDLSNACPELQWPNARLITKLRGSDWICRPLDLELMVANGPGTAVPCIVRGVTRLTPDEVTDLPKKERP